MSDEYLKTHPQPCDCPFCGAERKLKAESSFAAPTLLERLWSAGDRMAGLLCEHIKGHPMNCQCKYDKALQEYLQIKRDHPEPSNNDYTTAG